MFKSVLLLTSWVTNCKFLYLPGSLFLYLENGVDSSLSVLNKIKYATKKVLSAAPDIEEILGRQVLPLLWDLMFPSSSGCPPASSPQVHEGA